MGSECYILTIFVILLTIFKSDSYYSFKCSFERPCTFGNTICGEDGRCTCKEGYLLFKNLYFCHKIKGYCNNRSVSCEKPHQICNYLTERCQCESRYHLSTFGDCVLPEGLCTAENPERCGDAAFCEEKSLTCKCITGYMKSSLGKCAIDLDEVSKRKSQFIGIIVGSTFAVVAFLACCYGGCIAYTMKLNRNERNIHQPINSETNELECNTASLIIAPSAPEIENNEMDRSRQEYSENPPPYSSVVRNLNSNY